MATNWSQERFDCSTWTEREAERSAWLRSKEIVPRPPPRVEHPLMARVEADALFKVGDAPSKSWFIGWTVSLAALAGATIFLLGGMSFGVVGSAMTIAGCVVAIGLGHYLLGGRVLALGALRNWQQIQAQPDPSPMREAEPLEESSVGFSDREQRAPLRIGDHSQAAAEWLQGTGDGAWI
jgi:hypothetical protein